MNSKMCLDPRVRLSFSIIVNWLLLVFLVKLPVVTSLQAFDESAYEEIFFEQRNNYSYATISSPKFPSPFDIPYSKYYFMNASALPGFQDTDKKPVINFYFTDVFIPHQSITILKSDGSPVQIKWNEKIFRLEDSFAIIHVSVADFSDHLRTKLHFHENFGYNISIEVLHEKGPLGRGCSIRNCSFAGRCISSPGANELDFRCECVPKYHGAFCQYGPHCDPERNINVCLNGGTCVMMGYAGGFCQCPEGFGGSKCQNKKKEINFIEENEDCDTFNSIQASDRPCSVCKSTSTSLQTEGWKRYLFVVLASKLGSRFSRNPHLHWNFLPFYVPNFEEYKIGHQSVVTDRPARVIEEVYGKLSENYSMPSFLEIYEAQPVVAKNYHFPLKPQVIMNKEKEKPLLEGQEFCLSCRVKLPPQIPSTLVEFRWFKDHVRIRPEFSSRYKNLMQWGKANGTEAWYFLCVDGVTPLDMGIWTCQVTDLVRNVQECADYSMKVVVPPQLEVLPMSVTMVKDQQTIIMCSDSLEELGSGSHSTLSINWYKGQDKIEEDDDSYSLESIFPQGQLLRIHRATEDAVFTCKATNKGGYGEKSVEVRVLEKWASPYQYCHQICEDVETTGSRLVWGLTAINQTAKIMCPQKYRGYAQRQCYMGPSSLGKWGSSDFSRCTHQQLWNLNYTLHSMQMGYSVPSDLLDASLHNGLNNYLEMRKTNQSSSVGTYRLLNGEGDKFVNMLVDTFSYLIGLKSKNPKMFTKKQKFPLGMVQVVDNFLGFWNSCAHASAIDDLLSHFQVFTQEFGVNSFEGQNVIIQRKGIGLVEGNDSIILEIGNTTTNVTLDCIGNSSSEMSQEKDYYVHFMQLSGLSHLQEHGVTREDATLISDVVQVNISGSFCVKEGTRFEMEFQINDNSTRNKTCSGFYHSRWERNVCSINQTSDSVVTCNCPTSGTYAVFLLPEEHHFEPQVAELIQLPPDWIATSGCIVCLVLCLKTFVCGLLRRIFGTYFVLSSSAMIISTSCLLSLVQKNDSREVGFLYMLMTLSIQCLKIWRIVMICDIKENYPWLEYVPEWILPALIIIAGILPLFTAFFVDSLMLGTTLVTDQSSPVFISFAMLFAISVLTIFVVYYKTYLRLSKKNVGQTHCNRDEKAIRGIFIENLVHMVQVLSVALFLNMRNQIYFHYLMAILSCLWGLSSGIPKRTQSEKRRKINLNGDQDTAHMQPLNGHATIIPLNCVNRNSRCVQNRNGLELKSLAPLNKPSSSNPRTQRQLSTLSDEDELEQQLTMETTINSSSVNSVSASVGHSATGLSHLKPYLGAWPKRGECQLSLEDDNYVLSTNKADN